MGEARGRAWRQPLGGPGYEVVERALGTVARYGMLEGGETVLAAVSGGPDSTCLLDVLARMASKLELHVEVAHVDHGLSEDSASIAARVARAVAGAGFEIHLVRAPELEGPNLHARAREFRYEFFELVARRIDAARIATGHTLDDRVETTLARLIHGAGTEGLAGLPAIEGKRIRPLVEIRRAETRSYCEDRALAFVDDPANWDARFERAAVRQKLLSAIEERWGEGAVRAVARSADRLREDASALSALAERLYGEVAEDDDSGVRFELDALLSLPRALRRRLLEAAVGRVRDRSGGIDATLDALDAGRLQADARFAVAGGIEIVIGESDVTVGRQDLGLGSQ